jgi:hypothetical protein
MNENELAHYGVMGMKWGHRKAATGDQIRAARRHVDSERTKLDAQGVRAERAKGTKSEAKERNKYENMRVKFLRDPDRATAVRMTRGEKFATIITTTGLSALTSAGINTIGGAAVGAGIIAGRSAVARRIEQKQETGQYKKRTGKAATRTTIE